MVDSDPEVEPIPSEPSSGPVTCPMCGLLADPVEPTCPACGETVNPLDAYRDGEFLVLGPRGRLPKLCIGSGGQARHSYSVRINSYPKITNLWVFGVGCFLSLTPLGWLVMYSAPLAGLAFRIGQRAEMTTIWLSDFQRFLGSFVRSQYLLAGVMGVALFVNWLQDPEFVPHAALPIMFGVIYILCSIPFHARVLEVEKRESGYRWIEGVHPLLLESLPEWRIEILDHA